MTDGFRNPVIPGLHPDPSVCRVGDEYFLVASSFTYFPGVPVFRSRNLVDWEPIGHVLDRPSQLDLSECEWSSAGIYAPTIRHHDRRFFMITSLVNNQGLRNFVVTAEDPAGPWSDPVTIDIVGIDPDLAWDAEGNCWVHSSLMQIHRARVDLGTGEVLEPNQATWNGTGLHAPEAPHLYERDGVWYLLIAEGGTERGHAVSIARGPSPEGPWEGHPHNPIFSHRSSGSAIMNTGHADLVEAPDGSWWMVLLGVRPRGVTPAFHVLGRETFLVPVEWVDGWPAVGELRLEMTVRPPGPASPQVVPAVRDDFDGEALGHQWLSTRRPAAAFASLTARPSHLVLDGTGARLTERFPAYVGRRQQHHACRAATIVDAPANGRAGLAVYHDESAHYTVAVDGDRVVAEMHVGPMHTVVGEMPRPEGPVVLWARAVPDRGAPDQVSFGVDAGGVVHTLAAVDGRYLSTEVQGGFIGRTIGMFADDCTASFDWFDYEGEDG